MLLVPSRKGLSSLNQHGPFAREVCFEGAGYVDGEGMERLRVIDASVEKRVMQEGGL